MGPGAIGGFVAARLTEAGWPVTAVAHGETLRALRAGPLRLTDDDDERRVPVRAVGDPVEAGPADLALVCVKSFGTEAAARVLAPALADGAVVLSLQNGVTNRYSSGFVPALIVLTLVSAAAGREFKLTEVIMLAVLLAVCSVGLFIYGLGMPYPLFGGH